MRISDWSSDVCSSDLRRDHATERGAERVEHRNRQRPHFERKTLADRQIRRTCRGRSEEEHHRPGDRQAAGVDSTGKKQGRSEEQTSELQSLMRISSAVFRLKTTNFKS